MTNLIGFLIDQTKRHIPSLNEYNDSWPVQERSRETGGWQNGETGLLSQAKTDNIKTGVMVHYILVQN